MAYEPAPTLEQLPVQVEPEPEESVGSYCLRSVSAHGLKMHWLRRALGLSYTAHPTQAQWLSLAHVLQVSPEWLRTALPAKLDAPAGAWSYWGQRVLAGGYMRFRQPQVCIRCLHSRGFCPATWDFSFATACPVHGLSFQDRCDRCGRRFSWDRPALDICACGRILREDDEDPASSLRCVVATAISAHLHAGALNARAFEKVGVPGFLGDLSLNGLMSVLHAFGVRSVANEWIAPSATSRARTTEQWAAIVDRAGLRLRMFEEGGHPHSGLEALVCEALLKRLLRHPESAADLQVGRLLHGRLFGPVRRRRTAVEGQMELFA